MPKSTKTELLMQIAGNEQLLKKTKDPDYIKKLRTENYHLGMLATGNIRDCIVEAGVSANKDTLKIMEKEIALLISVGQGGSVRAGNLDCIRVRLLEEIYLFTWYLQGREYPGDSEIYRQLKKEGFLGV